MIKLRIFGAMLATLFMASNVACTALDYGGVGGLPANPDPTDKRTYATFHYRLKPGDHIVDAVKVYNNTDQNRQVQIYATDGLTTGDGNFSCAQRQEARHRVGRWVNVVNPLVRLSPRTSKLVNFRVALPQPVEPAEYNGCLVIEEVKPKNTSVGLSLTTRSALRIAIRSPGVKTAKLVFSRPNLRSTAHKVIFETNLKNAGTVSVQAKVEESTRLRTGFYNRLEEKRSASYGLLPSTGVHLVYELNRTLWGGWQKVLIEAKYSDQDQLYGKEKTREEYPNSTQQTYNIYIWPKKVFWMVVVAIIVGLWITRKVIFQRSRI